MLPLLVPATPRCGASKCRKGKVRPGSSNPTQICLAPLAPNRGYITANTGTLPAMDGTWPSLLVTHPRQLPVAPSVGLPPHVTRFLQRLFHPLQGCWVFRGAVGCWGGRARLQRLHLPVGLAVVTCGHCPLLGLAFIASSSCHPHAAGPCAVPLHSSCHFYCIAMAGRCVRGRRARGSRAPTSVVCTSGRCALSQFPPSPPPPQLPLPYSACPMVTRSSGIPCSLQFTIRLRGLCGCGVLAVPRRAGCV